MNKKLKHDKRRNRDAAFRRAETQVIERFERDRINPFGDDERDWDLFDERLSAVHRKFREES